MKKKILVFSLAYYPCVGGAEVAIKEITDRILDLEFHMVTLRFSKNDAKEERVGAVFVHRVGWGGSYLSKIFFIPLAAYKAVSLNRTEQFDAVWVMMLYMLFPLWCMRLKIKLPYALTLQEGDPYEHVFERWYIKLFRWMLKVGFKRARVIQVISNYLASWVRHNNYKGPLEIIPNGVDIAHFNKRVVHNDVRRTLNIRENELVLITVSRLVQKNGLDSIIKALPMIAGAHLLVLGNGPEEKKLKTLAKECGVANRVYFGGYVSHRALPHYLQAANIFIRPSRSEGMGNSFIEAMATGVPVVATQVGGIADFLFDAKRNPGKEPTGFAVDVDAPEQIAQAVSEIVSDPEATKRVVENARRMAFEKYNWEHIALQMRERVFGRLF
jgi:phosphatidylinositol alpha-1,6-mannosyltransferase